MVVARWDRNAAAVQALQPILKSEGVYSDTAGLAVSLTPETFNDPWPDPPQLSLVTTMTPVRDHEDGTRTISLEVNTTMHALTATQKATMRASRSASPSAADAKVFRQTSTVRLNGQVIQEQVVIPPGEDAGDPPT